MFKIEDMSEEDYTEVENMRKKSYKIRADIQYIQNLNFNKKIKLSLDWGGIQEEFSKFKAENGFV